jgi:cysteine synthase
MDIRENVTELVGNTPLVYVDRIDGGGGRIALKIEGRNPSPASRTGSERP